MGTIFVVIAVIVGIKMLLGLGFLIARGYYAEERQRLSRVRAELSEKAEALDAVHRLGLAAWQTRLQMREEARRFGKGRLQ